MGLIYILVLFLTGCSESAVSLYENKEVLFGAYFCESAPDSIPVRFCPQFFSEELHCTPMFSPDGMEVYWSLMGEKYDKILEMRRHGEAWSTPVEATFNLRNTNDVPFITPDQERLYFLSAQGSSVGDFDENIYYTTRSGDEWVDPVKLPDRINDHPLHWQFSVAANYNLYFQDSERHELYVSEYVSGNYQEPVKLPESINAQGSLEGSPFIDPDEEFLIFDRMTNGVYTDLYISFKDDENQWTEAVSLGNVVNTGGHETCPVVSHDHAYLFFLRSTASGLFPFWVDSEFINRLR